MACRLEHGVLELVLLGQGHHPKGSHPQQRRDVCLSLLTTTSTRSHLLRNLMIQIADIKRVVNVHLQAPRKVQVARWQLGAVILLH